MDDAGVYWRKAILSVNKDEGQGKGGAIPAAVLAPLGLGERRLPLADVWLEYVKSPNRNELSSATMKSKRLMWMHFAKWMEHNHLEVSDLAGVTAEAIAEYLACLRVDHSATTYNGRVCVLREIFHVLANKAGLDEDPWEGVRLRPDDAHSRRELTVEELGRLLEAAKKVSGTRRQRRAGCPSPQLPTGETPVGNILRVPGNRIIVRG